MMKRAVTVLAMAFAAGLCAQAAENSTIKVPDNLQVPVGNKQILVARAEGAQDYVCLPKADSFAWTLYGPQATLFAGKGNAEPVGTHFLSADAAGAGHPTWQANDLSRALGTLVASSSDNAYVATGSIPWLLLKAAATTGKGGGARFAHVTFVQRIDTAGGIAPANGCQSVTDIGAKALVPYTAAYVFYEAK
jgi:Protein of unknown function (DUF3455)